MIYLNLTRIISVAVILIGLVVMIGWATDDDSLKRINPDWVSMKLITAISFFASGSIVFFINESRNNNSEIAKIIMFAPLVVVLFFMAALSVSAISGIDTGVSSIFIKEDSSSAIKSVKAGIPSIGTMISFMVLIGTGFTFLVSHPKRRNYFRISGAIVLSLAITALVGYAIDNPLLYYQILEVSSAMALHTAIAFSLLGIGLILLTKSEYVEKDISKKTPFMKISTKLTLIMLISSLFTIILIGSISFDLGQSNLEKENFLKLKTIQQLKINSIENIFEEIKSDSVLAQSYFNLRTNLPIVSQHYENIERPDYIIAKEELDGQLSGYLESKTFTDDIILLDPNGIMVYHLPSSKYDHYDHKTSESFGKSFSVIDSTLLESAKNEQQFSRIFLDKDFQPSPRIFSIMGIYDLDDEFVGYYVLDLNTKKIFELIQDNTGLGNTGETLIGIKEDNFVVFIHPLKYDPDASFTRKIALDTEFNIPIGDAVQGNSGSGMTVDYRGVPVIASWGYIPSLEWGIVSKIDQTEAFSSISSLQQDITILGTVFIVGTAFYGFSTSRTISKPLIKLKELALKISQGDFDSKIKIFSSDEIGELSQMMNKTADKLKEANQQKDEFASMITHELKTPLVPIQGYCANLKNPKMGELNEQQKQAVDEIYNNSVELLRLIQNILNAQKIELHQLKFNIENISLDEYMNEKHKALSTIMKEKNIHFINSTEKGLSVKADTAKLNEIITNLVQNSVDFVPEKNGTIEIGAKLHKKEILFYVKDNGIGIPKDKIQNLFKKFYQIDTSFTRKHGGSGLGLAICKGYVEGMSGKIWLESEVDKGTSVFFTLPKAD